MDVTFIIPLFRGAKYVDEILNNIHDNSKYVNTFFFCNIEVIFVNDYPDEKIVSIGTKYNDIKVTILNNKNNKGIHYSRIKGLNHACGTYVVFLDQDDKIEPEFVYSQLTAINDAGVVLCNGIYREYCKIMPNQQAISNVMDCRYYFANLDGIVSPGQALIRKSIIPYEWKHFILKKNYCDDAFLWLLLKHKGIKLAVNDKILYYHNENGNNASLRWSETAQALCELLQVIKNNNFFKKEYEELLVATLANKIKKHTCYAEIETKFRQLEQGNGVRLKDYLRREKIEKVAIYGYGILGKRLSKVLKAIDIEIMYAIDKKEMPDSDIIIKNSFDNLEQVDLIIVSPVMEYASIKNELKKYVKYPIISLYELLEI